MGGEEGGACGENTRVVTRWVVAVVVWGALGSVCVRVGGEMVYVEVSSNGGHIGNVSDLIEDLLDGYDIRLRPQFGGRYADERSLHKRTHLCRFDCLCPSVCLCLSLSTCISVCLCLTVYVSVCCSLSLSLCLSLYLSLYLSICLSLSVIF